MKERKSTHFVILGGLGNQLFGVSAALYYQSQHGCEVSISLRELDQGITAHGVSIEKFALPVVYEPLSRFLRLNSIVRRTGRSLQRRIPLVPSRLLKEYISPVIGFDAQLQMNLGVSFIQGYFQSHIYAASLRKVLTSGVLAPQKESDWLQEMKQKAAKQKPVILHVRRGDYQKVAESIGVLSMDFFAEALREVRHLGNQSRVWLFSNAPIECQEHYVSKLDSSVEIIRVPSWVDDVEVMTLMQYGSAHLISNSTFSWWPAFLSPTSQIVVSPKPWFRTLPEPEGLIPNSWIRVRSKWE
jgi:hypothetical protein